MYGQSTHGQQVSLEYTSASDHIDVHRCMGMLRLLTALLLHAVACEGQSSRLTASSTISGNQTLVSDGEGDFALGFFTPSSSSSNRYMGIWDNKIPGKFVVWVANRETPLTNADAGAVTITEDGNLAVLDSNGTAVWSSGLPISNATTFAVLFHDGNLLLKRAAGAGGGVDTVVWQSFDRPGNTWLPDMKLWVDTKTGETGPLVSWRDEKDPSTGEFSLGIDPVLLLQLKIWRRGSESTWQRSDVWNGLSVSAGQHDATGAVVVQQMDFTGGRLSFSLSITDGSPPVRLVLSPSGFVESLFWQPSKQEWLRSFRIVGTVPLVCYPYNKCGRNAACSDNVTAAAQPYCRCLTGFVPAAQQEWDKGNHSRGCTRRVPLPCNRKGEGFLKMDSMKLPDGFRLVVDANEEQCLQECLGNCSCTAYSYSNASVVISRTRCLVWAGDLNDLTYHINPSEDGLYSFSHIYIRLAASELVTQQTNLSSSKKSIVFFIAVPVIVIGLLLSVALVYILIRRYRGRRESVNLDDLKLPTDMGKEERPTTLKVLDFSSLQAATGNFSVDNRLGEGGFGSVYKGKLHGEEEVAIKRLSKWSGQGFKEFRTEVEVIARLQHVNLVRLLGWCVHDNEKILIYEYMPNESLDKILFDPTRKEELTWPRRFHVIQGIAQGLLYLHRYSRLRIIHRDMKPSNVLLDDEMNPKISDFGLARIIGKHQTEGNTKKVVGTIGYMSPEYAFHGLFSEKSDVFAFGVMILEIVTGKRTTAFYSYNKETLNLLGYVWEHWKEGKGLDITDYCLRSDFSTEAVKKCIQIGLLCTQEKAIDRPTMASVVSMLDTQSDSLPLPDQPAFSTQRYTGVVDSQGGSSILYSLNASTTCSGANVNS